MACMALAVLVSDVLMSYRRDVPKTHSKEAHRLITNFLVLSTYKCAVKICVSF